MQLVTRRLPGLALVLVVGLAHAPRARAAEAPGGDLADTVELEDGGFLRGTIVEFMPGKKIVLRLPGGELRTIPAAALRAASRGGKALPIGPAGEAPPSPPAAEGAGAPGGTVVPAEVTAAWAKVPGPRVKIAAAADRLGFLERRIGEDDGTDSVAYHVVCRLPCEAVVPARDPQPYRIGALRTEPTPWLAAPDRDVTLRASLAAGVWPLWPRGTLVAGLFFAALGGAAYGINELGPQAPWLRTTSFVSGGLGGGFLLSSAILALVRPRTTLAIEPYRPVGEGAPGR